MPSKLTTSSLSAAAGSVVTAAAFSFPWNTPKPPPAPTFPVNVPIAVYIDSCGDEQQGPCVCTYHAQAWGKCDCATGKDIPLTDAEKQRVMAYASMWGDYQNPRYMVTATVPLPDYKTLQGAVSGVPVE